MCLTFLLRGPKIGKMIVHPRLGVVGAGEQSLLQATIAAAPPHLPAINPLPHHLQEDQVPVFQVFWLPNVGLRL